MALAGVAGGGDDAAGAVGELGLAGAPDAEDGDAVFGGADGGEASLTVVRGEGQHIDENSRL